MPSIMPVLLRPLAAALLLLSLLPRPSLAAAVLRSAEGAIAFSTAAACEVALTVVVAEAAEVEHRLEVLDDTQVELLTLSGARQAGAPHEVGRTLLLRTVPSMSGGAYTLRYRVTQDASRRHRCPLWLPTTPADGRSRAVRLAVTIPDGAVAAATMPAFHWTGLHGEAVLPHLPSVVIVPFSFAGAARPWDVSRAMDVTALLTLVGGTALWLRRQRRSR